MFVSIQNVFLRELTLKKETWKLFCRFTDKIYICIIRFDSNHWKEVEYFKLKYVVMFKPNLKKDHFHLSVQ